VTDPETRDSLVAALEEAEDRRRVAGADESAARHALERFDYEVRMRDRCKEIVARDGWWRQRCSRKNGHGPGGKYCKQHAKRYEGEVAQ
jgi:hypothetical protein